MEKHKQMLRLVCRIMKITIYQLLLTFLFAGASFARTADAQNTLARKISIQAENQGLRNVLSQIQRLADVRFTYSSALISPRQNVTITAYQQPLSGVLDQLFQDAGIHYKLEGKQIILQSRPLNYSSEENNSNNNIEVSTDRNIQGTVSDEKGAALPGVSILVKGTQRGTITDSDGRFDIDAPNGGVVLVFSFVGYVSQEVVVGSKAVIDIALKEDEKALDELVVVGYGEQSRTKLTSAISKLDKKVLEHAAIANVGSALQGTIPGLRVINSTGQPGSLPSIILRGGASINNPGSPLVVVDGIVRTLNDINSSDIESIQVLKDAASTAVYGARANNGVILITTNQGKVGVSQLTYKSKMGINTRRDTYNYLNAKDYIYYNRIALNNTNLSRSYGGVAAINPDNVAGYGFVNPHMFDIAKINDANRSEFGNRLNDGWQWMIDPISEGDTIIFKDYGGQIQKASFNNSANTQDHNIGFSGGNNKGKFSSNLGYYSEDGLVVGTSYERFSGTFNGSYKVRDNLEVFTGATFSDSKMPAFIPGDLFFRIQSMYPTFKPYMEDGTPSSGSNISYSNPLYYVDKYIRKNNTRKSIFNTGVSWEIVPEITLKAQGSISYADYTEENFDKKIVYQTGATNINRNASATYSKSLQSQHNVTLEYRKNIKKHYLNVLLGGEYFNTSSFNLSAEGKSAPTDDIYTLNSAVERTSISSNRSEYRMLSAFGRVNYDYEGKYLFSAVIRSDGTSSLGDHKWGTFPGISAGWNIHKENFFKSSVLRNFISILKPRLSYGISGNIAGIGNYEVQGLYGIQRLYNTQSSYLNTGIENRALRWERSKSLDAGIELGLLNHKIFLAVNYFSRITTDLLTSMALPGYTGFNSYRTNLGSLLNTGFESEISANLLRSKNGLNWDITFNSAFVKNKILKLPYNGNENNRQGGEQIFDPKSGKVIWVGGYQEGNPIGDVVAYKQERIFRDWNDINENAANRYDKIAQLYGPEAYANLEDKKGKFPIEPGDVLWADFDGNNIIDSYDRYVVGNIFPKWTGGASTTFSFKNIALYGRVDYAIGHIIHNSLASTIMGQNVGNMNFIDWVYDAWTPENPNADRSKLYFGDYPKLNIKRTGGGENVNNNNSKYYEKGDYLALREVTLSYSFPKSMVSKIKFSSLQAHITGQNIAYFNRQYTGYSPELGGVDLGRYPLPRSIVFGISASF